MMYRIVSEKRGDAVMGFRVQKQGISRHPVEGTKYGCWRNRGRRVFTVADAETLRDFLVSQDQASAPPIVYEEISPMQSAKAWHRPRVLGHATAER